jgi:hypothetical protein
MPKENHKMTAKQYLSEASNVNEILLISKIFDFAKSKKADTGKRLLRYRSNNGNNFYFKNKFLISQKN